MAVEHDILPHALVEFIKATLLPSLSGLFLGFPWDFSKMAVRESTSWQDVMKVDPATPYFDGRFLKAKPGAKNEGVFVFSPPKNPVEFSLIVDHEQWIEAEDYQENKVSNQSQTNSNPRPSPTPVIHRSMRSRRSVRIILLYLSCIYSYLLTF